MGNNLFFLERNGNDLLFKYQWLIMYTMAMPK